MRVFQNCSGSLYEVKSYHVFGDDFVKKYGDRYTRHYEINYLSVDLYEMGFTSRQLTNYHKIIDRIVSAKIRQYYKSKYNIYSDVVVEVTRVPYKFGEHTNTRH